jgi:hypothetical protein
MAMAMRWVWPPGKASLAISPPCAPVSTYHSNRAEADGTAAAIEALGRKAAALRLDAGDVASFDGFAGEVGRALK